MSIESRTYRGEMPPEHAEVVYPCMSMEYIERLSTTQAKIFGIKYDILSRFEVGVDSVFYFVDVFYNALNLCLEACTLISADGYTVVLTENQEKTRFFFSVSRLPIPVSASAAIGVLKVQHGTDVLNARAPSNKQLTEEERALFSLYAAILRSATFSLICYSSKLQWSDISEVASRLNPHLAKVGLIAFRYSDSGYGGGVDLAITTNEYYRRYHDPAEKQRKRESANPVVVVPGNW